MLIPINTKRGRELHNKDPKHEYTLIACSQCQKQRWVRSSSLTTITGLCRSCLQRHDRNSRWKDGKTKNPQGYISIQLFFEDFFYPMANKRGRVLEHRLVIAKSLGRCLHRWEIVHHINGIKDDNRIENLQLSSTDGHNATVFLQNRIAYLEKENNLLRAEVEQIHLLFAQA